MNIIGVIFDFNGTMLFDRKYHLEAWRVCIEDLIMQDISNQDVLKYVDGKNGKEILEHFLGYDLSGDMITQFCQEKERIYRNMIVKDHPPLTPGLPAFLDYLSEARVPLAIATSAPIQNVNLYFDEYELFRWFDWDHIIMAAEGVPEKPHPALYLQAIKQVQVEANHCLCFEDSSAGIRAAYTAGIRNIVNVTGDMPACDREEISGLPGVIRTIWDFTQLKDKDLEV